MKLNDLMIAAGKDATLFANEIEVFSKELESRNEEIEALDYESYKKLVIEYLYIDEIVPSGFYTAFGKHINHEKAAAAYNVLYLKNAELCQPYVMDFL